MGLSCTAISEEAPSGLMTALEAGTAAAKAVRVGNRFPGAIIAALDAGYNVDSAEFDAYIHAFIAQLDRVELYLDAGCSSHALKRSPRPAFSRVAPLPSLF